MQYDYCMLEYMKKPEVVHTFPAVLVGCNGVVQSRRWTTAKVTMTHSLQPVLRHKLACTIDFTYSTHAKRRRQM